MNSIDVVKGLLNNGKYEVITEYAKIQHGKDSADVVVREYSGTHVRMCKNDDDGIEILYPKNADVTMEGAIANAIANGTIFDDADEIDNNATMIEKTCIPCSGMANKGLDEPKTVKKVIAIVIGKMDDDGRFEISDTDRENGVKFVKDITDYNREGGNIREVINNYTEKDNDETYDSVVGKQMTDLNDELDDINSVKYDDTIDDASDTVDNYDDYDFESLEKDPEEGDDNDDEEPSEPDNGTDDSDDGDDDKPELPDDSDDDDSDSDNDDSEDGESDDKDEDEKDDKDESVEECGDSDTTTIEEGVSTPKGIPASELTDQGNSIPIGGASPKLYKEECKTDKIIREKKDDDEKYKAYEEGFLTRKPKKLKPIGRDTVAYITTMINDIHSSTDQAMLAGYTCNKIELVDFYITAIDTQDAKYVVPHSRAYLVTLKNDLEILLARILRIRPINRSEQIWRVNYPV